jgi:hypothetical protein
MKHMLMSLVFIVLLIPFTLSQDANHNYAGKSGCRPELRWAPGTYSIRLDSGKRTDLKAYTVNGQNLLFIVQHADDRDACGVIRDVVQPGDATSSFVWDCMDPKSPHMVVVGTWPAHHPHPSGPAVEAWRIDLTKLEFVPIHTKVQCSVEFGPGSDDGLDLVTLRKKFPPRTN